jgi:hypothetical protein
MITLMRACCKVRDNNIRIRNLEHVNNQRRQEHDSRLKRVLDVRFVNHICLGKSTDRV